MRYRYSHGSYGYRRSYYRGPSRPISTIMSGIIVAVIGGAVAFFGMNEVKRMDDLRNSGQKVEAQIIGASFKTTRRTDEVNDDYTYYVRVRFAAPEGGEVEENKRVPEKLYDRNLKARVAEPEAKHVVVDPKDKKNWELAEMMDSERASSGAMPLVGLGVIGLGLIIAAVGVVQGVRRGSMFALPAGYDLPTGYGTVAGAPPQPYPQAPPYPQAGYPRQNPPYPQAGYPLPQGYAQQCPPPQG